MKSLFFLLIVMLPLFSFAQNTDSKTINNKLDSILAYQKKIYAEQRNEPLANKKYGIEVNPFRILLVDLMPSFSGTFSMFNVNRHAELAFPIYFQFPKTNNDFSEVSVDCHYRYFLGNTQNGFYLSGFARVAHLSYNNHTYIYLNSNQYTTSDTKFGIGFGMGFRKFSYRGIYWGASLSVGRFFSSNTYFDGVSSFGLNADGTNIIFDIEFFKVGYAF